MCSVNILNVKLYYQYRLSQNFACFLKATLFYLNINNQISILYDWYEKFFLISEIDKSELKHVRVIYSLLI